MITMTDFDPFSVNKVEKNFSKLVNMLGELDLFENNDKLKSIKSNLQENNSYDLIF